MLVDFFLQLKQAKVPVPIREYLSLLEALDKQVIWGSVEDFYYRKNPPQSPFVKGGGWILTLLTGEAGSSPC